MAVSIEPSIKSTFTKLFVQNDWKLFKTTADYYFKRSAHLVRSDIGLTGNSSLLFRNIQKRLFLGIGGELLLKAYFLKEGYIINTPRDRKTYRNADYMRGTIPDAELDKDNTFTFGPLLDVFHRVSALSHQTEIKNALAILKVFRNKEGHVVTRKHAYKPSVYREIENGLRFFYEEGFSQRLTIFIKMEARDRAHFSIR